MNTTPSQTALPHLALACSGLGRIQRGHETFIEEVAAMIGNNTSFQLYKGGVGGPAGQWLPNLPRNWSLKLKLTQNWERAYRWEQFSFAIGLSLACYRHHFAAVYFPDLAIAAVLRRLRRLLKLPTKLLFSNGGPFDPEHCAHVDYMHVLTPLQYRQALAAGFNKERLFEIPYGFTTARFAANPEARARWRQQLNIAANTPVILCLASLSERTKRLGWLIDELTLLTNRDFVFVAAGARADDSAFLEQQAQSKLAGRFRFLTLASHTIPDFITCADVAVLASLNEGFGRAIIETAAAGVPTLVNNNDHFRWLLTTPGSHTDVSRHGPLAKRLEELLAQPQARQKLGLAQQAEVQQRFDWERLRPRYLKMFATVANGQIWAP